jgi:hypothetical protein
MKQGTTSHPKTADLMEALGIPRYSAVGILESLWHFSRKYAEAGDVGRFSNVQIAQAVDWIPAPGHAPTEERIKKADELIAALVRVHWLDEHPKHRLIVHDWHEHCEDAVHNSLARAVEYFADGTMPKLSRLSREEKDQVSQAFKAKSENQPKRRTRNAQKTHAEPTALAPPNPTLPNPDPSPTQPVLGLSPAPPEPRHTHSGSGSNGGGSMAGFGLGRVMKLELTDAERMLEVQSRLSRANVNADVQQELIARKDITPSLVDREWTDICNSKKPTENPAGVLVKRLRQHKPGVRR